MSEYDIVLEIGYFTIFVLKVAIIALIVATIVQISEAVNKHLVEKKNKPQPEVVVKKKDKN